MRALICALALCAHALSLAGCASAPAFGPATPLVLTGEITRADHQTYREIPFTVPARVKQITVDFAYTGKEQKTVIDLGLRDPQGQRGWSGGNKTRFVVGETRATPSYRPAPIQAGDWKLVLGIPNIRDGQTASWTATISFAAREGSEGELAAAYQPVVLSAVAGWRRGDFHTHTAHSDGSCEDGGARAPCPPDHTFSAARDAGLDFVAITDHNTITQLADIARQQAHYPKTLLIPGTEVTTFNGHMNAVGLSNFVDFQLGSPRLPDLGKLFDEAEAQGAFISVNHPGLPSGELCMGCGWTEKDTDWSRVSAIEVVNGSTLRTSGAESGLSGIALWDRLLKQGYRITAIGGSDNHDATDVTGAKQSPVGKPATVVFAKDLSVSSIVAGVRSGRVFVDVAGLPDATLDMTASAGKQAVAMGGELKLKRGEQARLDVMTANLPAGAQIEMVAHGLDFEQLNGGAAYHLTLSGPEGAGWARLNARDAAGKLLLLSNPIYFVRADGP